MLLHSWSSLLFIYYAKVRFLIPRLRCVKDSSLCPCNIQRFFISSKTLKFREKNLDIFLIFAQNKDCGYTLEPPRRGGSHEHPQSIFWSKNKKNRYTPAYPSSAIFSGVQGGIHYTDTFFSDERIALNMDSPINGDSKPQGPELSYFVWSSIYWTKKKGNNRPPRIFEFKGKTMIISGLLLYDSKRDIRVYHAKEKHLQARVVIQIRS